MISMHTSPLDQPGQGDAGGMNVYVLELSRQLAAFGTEVEIFTRATRSDLPAEVQVADGVLVRHLPAGPYEGLAKEELPAQLCAFTAALLRTEAEQAPGWYDVVHAHYWLSGQVGWVASERWGVPLVHTAHTLGRVKNAQLALGDSPEPRARLIGEDQVVAAADRLVASTETEAAELLALYGAQPGRVDVVAPGVDLDVFRPGQASTARTRLGVPPDALVLLFVGRIQPLKGPQVLLAAVAELVTRQPQLRRRLQVVVAGAPSGSGLSAPDHLVKLACELGVADLVRFEPPVDRVTLAEWFRAADAVTVPSYNESFGLVALEAQACGTPVVAAAVGGLHTAVQDGRSGILVAGHDPAVWARELGRILTDAPLRERLAGGARAHATTFGWDRTAGGVLDSYRTALEAPRRAERRRPDRDGSTGHLQVATGTGSRTTGSRTW